MDPITSNPFGVLTFIAAPAVLTNASSLMVLSTVNRLLRISDRMRNLSAQLDKETNPEVAAVQLNQVNRTEVQASMILAALRAVYISLSSFIAASLVSILGAVVATSSNHLALQVAVGIALALGIMGALGILYASVQLFRASQLSVINITEEASLIRAKEKQRVRVKAD